MQESEIMRDEEDRNDRYRREMEDYLRTWTIDGYSSRSAKAWKRNYKSVEAYEKSIAPNRERWRRILNPPALEIAGRLDDEPFRPLADVGGRWLRLPLADASGFGTLRAEAAFCLPKKGKRPYPLVIAQHGIGSTPERTWGLGDATNAYRAFSRVLIENGYAVLAPFNLAKNERRCRMERVAKMAGTSLPGIEFVRMQRLLDVLLKTKEVDASRVGFWGLSLGGFAAQFWVPLEPRVKVAISAGWFNKRIEKMIVPDPRYGCFLECAEEHAFIRDWLVEFDDADQCSLICPRPFLVQTGKCDGIAWWPFVMEAFNALKTHYEKLGLAERVAIDLHEEGHKVRIDSGLAWLKRWL